jgi:uncharacterized protein (TIGR03118 family)
MVHSQKRREPVNRPYHFRPLLIVLVFVFWASGQARAQQYTETNLISNESSVAPITDANLVDPWGFAFSSTGPLWVSNQGSSTATVYKITGTTSSATQLTVGVANIGNAAPSNANGPTGQVSTTAAGITTLSTDFQVSGGKSSFIFDNLDGSISAWRGGLTTSPITASVAGASFTGLAIANNSSTGAAQVYAADQNSGNVDVFNGAWQQAGVLTDPSLPAGFSAFNVQNLGGTLFVTYANPNNPLGGVVDEFNTNGSLITRLITDPSGNHLDSPWGLAIAPAGWGQFGGDLLVGNNGGDGTINAYSLAGTYEGQIDLGTTPFSEEQLWALSFGNGGSFGSANTLYFDAGYTTDATNGLIGAVSVPEPTTGMLCLLAIGQLATARRSRRRAA